MLPACRRRLFRRPRGGPSRPRLAAESEDANLARFERTRVAFGHVRERFAACGVDTATVLGEIITRTSGLRLPQLAVFTGAAFQAKDWDADQAEPYDGDPEPARTILETAVDAEFDVANLERFTGDQLLARAPPAALLFEPDARLPVGTRPAGCRTIPRASPGSTTTGPATIGSIDTAFDRDVLGKIGPGCGSRLASLSNGELLRSGDVELRQSPVGRARRRRTGRARLRAVSQGDHGYGGRLLGDRLDGPYTARVLPPEISSAAPVVKPLSGEARNAMAAAISSGFPKRPSGNPRSRASAAK